MLLHINGKYTITKLKSSLFSKSVVLNRPLLSISSSRSRYEADISVSVVSFISSSIETRKYQTNFMISLYWCDLYCISISVAFFLRLYRQTRFPNCACPYKIYDIYNVLTFLLAFLIHFGTYGQYTGKLVLGNFFTIWESPSQA